MKREISFYGGYLNDVFVGGAKRGEADHLRELGELRVGEERHVAEQLVDTVGLGRVQRRRAVSDVLCALEDAEGQAGQEVPCAQQARHRSQLKARLSFLY